MSFRYMRVIIFFDLPTVTSSELKEYRKFRKFLIKNGFLMMQESVYCKIASNTNTADALIENVRRNKPHDGVVQALKITEKQYSNIDYIVRSFRSEVLDTTDRIVFL